MLIFTSFSNLTGHRHGHAQRLSLGEWPQRLRFFSAIYTLKGKKPLTSYIPKLHFYIKRENWDLRKRCGEKELRGVYERNSTDISSIFSVVQAVCWKLNYQSVTWASAREHTGWWENSPSNCFRNVEPIIYKTVMLLSNYVVIIFHTEKVRVTCFIICEYIIERPVCLLKPKFHIIHETRIHFWYHILKG